MLNISIESETVGDRAQLLNQNDAILFGNDICFGHWFIKICILFYQPVKLGECPRQTLHAATCHNRCDIVALI
jgi:hypothetical protein